MHLETLGAACGLSERLGDLLEVSEPLRQTTRLSEGLGDLQEVLPVYQSGLTGKQYQLTGKQER